MRHASFLFAASAFVHVACAAEPTTPTPRSPTMNSTATTHPQPRKDDGAALVKRIYEEAINGANAALLDELVSPEYVGPSGERGPAGFAANVEGVRAGFPDIRFRVEELVDGGDRVAIRWTWTGTHTGTFRGNAPTGKRVQNTGIAIYEIRNGKAVRAHLETDRLGILQALGVVPSPGAPPAKSP